MKQKKFILQEHDIPKHWYNIQADMPTKPMPPLNPQTRKPLTVDDLSHIFSKECSRQELDTVNPWIPIPDEVREKYSYYRATPLVRAYALEQALGTTAHIYFKNESTNPLGSHKINSAIPQCYYCKKEGDTNVTTETGAGQWGTALSYAAKLYGLEAAVYQVKITLQQKPYRSMLMRTFGATVEGSPSMSTRAGKDLITRNANDPGSLGSAISEAIELATTTPGCKYTLGSVMNHVGLHQTVKWRVNTLIRLSHALGVAATLKALHSPLCVISSMELTRKQSSLRLNLRAVLSLLVASLNTILEMKQAILPYFLCTL